MLRSSKATARSLRKIGNTWLLSPPCKQVILLLYSRSRHVLIGGGQQQSSRKCQNRGRENRGGQIQVCCRGWVWYHAGERLLPRKQPRWSKTRLGLSRAT